MSHPSSRHQSKGGRQRYSVEVREKFSQGKCGLCTLLVLLWISAGRHKESWESFAPYGPRKTMCVWYLEVVASMCSCMYSLLRGSLGQLCLRPCRARPQCPSGIARLMDRGLSEAYIDPLYLNDGCAHREGRGPLLSSHKGYQESDHY